MGWSATDLKGMRYGDVDWSHLTQGRNHGHGVVIMVMYLPDILERAFVVTPWYVVALVFGTVVRVMVERFYDCDTRILVCRLINYRRNVTGLMLWV